MGRPGSGKGTQARLLSEKTGFQIFSTGDVYRKLAAEDTFLGRKIKNIIDKGNLTPYWFASYLFEKEILNLAPDKGIIFEGVGRREPEAKMFHDVVEWLERPYVIFYLEASEKELKKRLFKRAQVEGRADDAKEEHIETRFQEYEKYTQRSVEFFQSVGTVVHINGEQSPEQVHADIMERIETL